MIFKYFHVEKSISEKKRENASNLQFSFPQVV